MRLDELLQREERRLQEGLRQRNESSSPGVAKPAFAGALS